MSKLKHNQKGVGVVEAILMLVIICMIVGTGWYVYGALKNTNSTYNSAASTSNSPTVFSKISTKDGKVYISLPSSWHVVPGANNSGGGQFISTDANSQNCVGAGGTCGTAGCLGFEDTNPCVYEAAFQPKKLSEKTDPVWTLTVEKTDQNIQGAVTTASGGLTADNTVKKNSSPINGYDSLYVKVKGGDPSSEYYVDDHYFIEKDGYLLHLNNREQYINASNTSASYNVSKYDGDFMMIANSVKINL
jgi:hypothetical protein